MPKQRALKAKFNQRSRTIVVALDSGLELRFRPEIVPELRRAGAAELRKIEITPSGLGLCWPQIDVDLHIDGILRGKFGPRSDRH